VEYEAVARWLQAERHRRHVEELEASVAGLQQQLDDAQVDHSHEEELVLREARSGRKS